MRIMLFILLGLFVQNSLNAVNILACPNSGAPICPCKMRAMAAGVIGGGVADATYAWFEANASDLFFATVWALVIAGGLDWAIGSQLTARSRQLLALGSTSSSVLTYYLLFGKLQKSEEDNS